MNIEEAKALFKQKYALPWLKLIEEHPEELLYQNRHQQQIKVSADELRSYMTFEPHRSAFLATPVECSMCSKDYREQMISPADRIAWTSLGFNRALTFGDPSCGGMYVEIGRATPAFQNYFRFADKVHDYSLQGIRRRGPRRPLPATFEKTLFCPTTIRVYNVGASDIAQAVKRTQSIIEGCLFNLSYLNSAVYSLDEQWPRPLLAQRHFEFPQRPPRPDRVLPLPKGRINTDILRFYQRGMSTDDPFNQFLSYYQILEYFFLSISDEELYRKLAATINDPAFSATPRQLDRVIQETTNHKRESDETEMLRLVISRYADETELIGFIGAYEEYLGEKWYSKKRRLFGEDSEVRPITGHIVGNVAKRVKLIRNALVHSSDRYNRQETFVPSPDSEAVISKEVPLVKYLGEKVIIGNSYERS